METLIVAVFVASAVGSLHCAGMCGPLVAFAVTDSERSCKVGWRYAFSTRLHLLYHGGRLIAYSALGAACGSLGAVLDMSGAVVGVQRIAATVAGATMILAGLVALLRTGGVHVLGIKTPGWIQAGVVSLQQSAVTLKPAPRAATIGLLSAILPCGWLYFFAITAAGTASPFWGAAVMASFWAGTVPILLLVGASAQAFVRSLGEKASLFASLAVIALGLYTVAGRMDVSPAAFAAENERASLSDDSSLDRVQSLNAADAPCCKAP